MTRNDSPSVSRRLITVFFIGQGLAAGTAFQAQAVIDDGYHPLFTLAFPSTAIHTFQVYLPLIAMQVPDPLIMVDHTATDLSTRLPQPIRPMPGR
jgi:hypothetical protein